MIGLFHLSMSFGKKMALVITVTVGELQGQALNV